MLTPACPQLAKADPWPSNWRQRRVGVVHQRDPGFDPRRELRGEGPLPLGLLPRPNFEVAADGLKGTMSAPGERRPPSDGLVGGF
jgi:hypothetical protein